MKANWTHTIPEEGIQLKTMSYFQTEKKPTCSIDWKNEGNVEKDCWWRKELPSTGRKCLLQSVKGQISIERNMNASKKHAFSSHPGYAWLVSFNSCFFSSGHIWVTYGNGKCLMTTFPCLPLAVFSYTTLLRSVFSSALQIGDDHQAASSFKAFCQNRCKNTWLKSFAKYLSEDIGHYFSLFGGIS